MQFCTTWSHLLEYNERRREVQSSQVRRHQIDNGLGYYWAVVDDKRVFVGFVHAFFKNEACRLVKEFNPSWRVYGERIAK